MGTISFIALLISLKYSTGRHVSNSRKSFFAAPYFIEALLAHSVGWLPPFFFYAFSRSLKSTGERNYDSDELYSPTALSAEEPQNLPNGDLLNLANQENLNKIKQVLIGENPAETKFPEEQVMQLFDQLPTVESSLFVGKHFSGKLVATNPDQVLSKVMPGNDSTLKWGKVFWDRHDVNGAVFSLGSKYFSLPFTGNATVADEVFRGKTTACLSYEALAQREHFVMLESHPLKVLGVYMLKEKLGGFFILTETQDSFSRKQSTQEKVSKDLKESIVLKDPKAEQIIKKDQ